MLLGSYAGGSLCRHRPLPFVAGPAPPPSCMPASRLPSRSGRFPISSPPLRADLLCRATPPPFTALLLLCASRHLAALPSHGEAEQSKAFAFRRDSLLRHRHASRGLAKPFPRSAEPCCSLAMPCISKPLPSRALPSPCYAVAHPITAPPCLRHAMFRFAFARLCSAKQRLRCPYQSIAVACRGFASPLP